MATLTPQFRGIAGGAVTYAAASGGGDSIPYSVRGRLRIKNGSGATITGTLVVPGNNEDGVANPDPTYAVAAGAEWEVSNFQPRHINPSTGLIDFTWSGVTSLTLALVDS
jgi:hypothetical protein